MVSRRGEIGILVVAMAMLLLAASCTSRKKLAAIKSHADYQWVTAKMTMDVKAPGLELINVSGALRMRRDSAIWISASMMGMENVRTLITEDSIILLNRVDKTYLTEPLDSVAQKLNVPMTLRECQVKLIGNGTSDHVEVLFGPYSAKIRYSDIRWDEPTTFPIKISKKYERMKL